VVLVVALGPITRLVAQVFLVKATAAQTQAVTLAAAVAVLVVKAVCHLVQRVVQAVPLAPTRTLVRPFPIRVVAEVVEQLVVRLEQMLVTVALMLLVQTPRLTVAEVAVAHPTSVQVETAHLVVSCCKF
jgi:hypothetical protein